jgi:hypothetical protein
MKNNSNRSFLTLSLSAFSLGGALLLAPSAHAQTDLRVQTQNRVANLFSFAQTRVKALNLSTKQKTQLQQIARKNGSSTTQIWSDPKLSPAQRNAKFQSLRTQALAVLTPAQRVKVDETKRLATSRLLETALWVSNELELSGDQQQRVMSIVQRQMNTGRTQGFGALRSSIVQTNSQISAVLTPAQRTKWATIQSAARSEFVKRGKQFRASEPALNAL